MIGKTLGGYRIIEQIGMGGMATVYKAYDPGTDRYVAVKVLPQQYAQDTEFQARFQQEAKAIAHLEHLHILPVFAYGEEEGTPYMVMRYMDAGTLADFIKRKPLNLQEIARFLSQIASALDYAHDNGIIHRDVKPSNVLVDRQGNAFLTDFGIAKILEGGMKLTGTGSIIGTPQYMSPEQLEPGNEVAGASDQYSLGVIFFEMATGQTPYQAVTPWAIIAMHQRREPMPLPRTLNPNLPEAVEQVILKSLAREPDKRYENCSAMAAAFQRVISEVATDASAATRTAHPTRREEAGDLLTSKGLSSGVAPVLDEATSTLKQRRAGTNWRTWAGIAALVVAGILITLGVTFSSNNATSPTSTTAAEITVAETIQNTAGVTLTAENTSSAESDLTPTINVTQLSTPTDANTAALITMDGVANEWENIPVFEDVQGDSTGILDIISVRTFADDEYLYVLVESVGGDWNDIYSLQVEIDTNQDHASDYRLVTIRDMVLMGPNDSVSPNQETLTEVHAQSNILEARIPLAEMEAAGGQTLQLLVVYYFETSNPNVEESDAVPNVPQGIPVSYLPSP